MARGFENGRDAIPQKSSQSLYFRKLISLGGAPHPLPSLALSLSFPLSWREKKLCEFQTFKVAVKLRKQDGEREREGTQFTQIPRQGGAETRSFMGATTGWIIHMTFFIR